MSLLTRTLNQIATLLPDTSWFGFLPRLSSPVSGTRYRVRHRVSVPVVLLPLTPPVRRFDISLPPTTQIRIASATRPDEPHVYAHLDTVDAVALIPERERAAALTTGFLLEVPRRSLQSQFVIA